MTLNLNNNFEDASRFSAAIAGVMLGPIKGPFISPSSDGYTPITVYTGISGPSSIGSGGYFYADSGSGNIVGIGGDVNNLAVPVGYVSGSELGTSTDTWNNATLTSLGIMPGTYVYRWGTGNHADSFTVQAVPEPGISVQLGAGLLVLLLMVPKIRKKCLA